MPIFSPYAGSRGAPLYRPAPAGAEIGLVGWWPFNDGRAFDASGWGQNGALTNYPSIAPGVPAGGSSLRFISGASTYVNVPHSSIINLGAAGSSYTVSCWFNTTDANAGVGILMSKRAAGGGFPFAIAMGYGADNGNIYSDCYNGSLNPAVNTGVDYRDGKWHHAATRYDRGSSITVYIDGLQKATGTDTTGSSDLRNTDAVNIGRQGAGNYFKGRIAEPRLYSIGLTASQIYANYVQGISNQYLDADEWLVPSLQTVFPWWAVRNNDFVIGTGVQ